MTENSAIAGERYMICSAIIANITYLITLALLEVRSVE